MDLKYLLVFFSISLVGASYFDSTVSSDFTNVAEALNVQFSAVSSGSPCPNSVLNAQLSTIQGLPTLNKIPSTMSIKNFLRYYCFYQDGSGNHPNINQYIQITDGDATCYWSCPCTNLSLKTANIVLPTEEVSVACPTTSSSTSSSSATSSSSQESSGGSSDPSLGTIIGSSVGSVAGTIIAMVTLYKLFHGVLKKLFYKSNASLELKALKNGNYKIANYFGNRATGTTDVDEVEFAQIFRRVLFKNRPIPEKDVEITYKVIKKIVDILGDRGTNDASLNEELAELIMNIKIATSNNKISKSALVATEINKGKGNELSRLEEEKQEELLRLFESDDFKTFLKTIKGIDIEGKYNSNVLPNLKTFLTGEEILNYDAIEESIKGYLTQDEETALNALKKINRADYEKIIKQIVDIASSKAGSIKIEGIDRTKTPDQLIDIILKTLSDQIRNGAVPNAGFKFIFNVEDKGSGIFKVIFNQDYGISAEKFDNDFSFQKSLTQQGAIVFKRLTTRKTRLVGENDLTGNRWNDYDIKPIYHGVE